MVGRLNMTSHDAVVRIIRDAVVGMSRPKNATQRLPLKFVAAPWNRLAWHHNLHGQAEPGWPSHHW